MNNKKTVQGKGYIVKPLRAADVYAHVAGIIRDVPDAVLVETPTACVAVVGIKSGVITDIQIISPWSILTRNHSW